MTTESFRLDPWFAGNSWPGGTRCCHAGSGGAISAAVPWLGYNAKLITAIAVFTVPTSSLGGFLAYALGCLTIRPLLLTNAAVSLIGGLAGNETGQVHLSAWAIKGTVGVVALIIAAKILADPMAA